MADALPDPVTQAEFYADLPLKRFAAWVVDAALVAVLVLLALPLTAFLALFFLPVLWLVLSFLYRWLTLSRASATWGMRLVAIELRDRAGRRLDPGTALLHTLIYSVAMGTVFLQALSILLVLVSPRRQNLPDHILGTAAINRPAEVW
jgi:uncharacterized RDD family membrane protein YckC